MGGVPLQAVRRFDPFTVARLQPGLDWSASRHPCDWCNALLVRSRFSAMNWGRGLFGFWVATTALWIAAWIAIRWREIICKWSPTHNGWEEYRCNPFDIFDS